MPGTRIGKGVLPNSRREEYYASYVAGIFRTVRFGTGEAHGRAQMMEFNYLTEQGAILPQGDRYRTAYTKIEVNPPLDDGRFRMPDAPKPDARPAR